MGIKFNPNILQDPLGGLSMEYGVPSCMVGLAKDVLGLLPGDILGGLDFGLREGRKAAGAALAKINKTILRDLGIIEFDTATGKLKFLSETSKWGADSYAGGLLGDLGTFLGFVSGFGGALWKNYQVLQEQIESIQNCLNSFEEWLDKAENKSNSVTSSNDITLTSARFTVLKQQAESAMDFMVKCDNQIRVIAEILEARDADPTLEPEFVTDEGEEVTDPIFRLTFGPPKSKQGQFLLSQDGLYYDSQGRDYLGGQIPSQEDIGLIPDADKWKLDHAPSLGGRGTAFSIKDLNNYVDTMFDTEKIDDTKTLQEYYLADHLLQTVEAQRNLHVDRINDYLLDLIDEGYSPDSALYVNNLQQLNSTVAAYEEKIRKRKKQIEVAVKAPDLFGTDLNYEPGTIPVNDFSFLSSINLGVELEKQKGLVFDHGEVSGIVLPVQPKFVRASESQQGIVVLPLNVTPIATGGLLDGEELEGDAPLISITTGITMDDVIAVYNFTDANYVDTNSQEFETLNCAVLGKEQRAQTVSVKPDELFRKGLGIPYLNGLVVRDKENSIYAGKGETWDSYPFEIGRPGNFVRLPDTQLYQDLFYNTSGCTIDVWTKVEGLENEIGGFWEHPFTTSSFDFKLSSNTGGWTNAQYYRVLLANENTGGRNNNIDSSSVISDRSSDFVRGMLMGFSRDPKMYYEGGFVANASSDWYPREDFGAALNTISFTGGGYQTDISFEGASSTFEVSTNGGGDRPTAIGQASGIVTLVKSGGQVVPSYNITYKGDAYTDSSDHDTEFLIRLGQHKNVLIDQSDNPNINNLPSGTLDIPYYATGEDFELQIGTPSTVFFIAPTQSYNSSSVGFVRQGNCPSEEKQLLRFLVSTNTVLSTGKTLKETIQDDYTHLCVVFDVKKDEIRFNVDGELVKTGKISSTFGTNEYVPPSVPSFAYPPGEDTSSFYYSSATVGNRSDKAIEEGYFNTGPQNNDFFTPWIVGGGWTDGRDISLATSSGGFMSTGDGLHSSYNGHVGSLKFYSKPLNNEEVKANYEAQKVFFKNIE